ncbi:MAG: hypothetical protein QOI98_1680, partial [Solirubrobacteraceae bacterium]|nr:hypothetical protein [Solirubrobacteraceae bacterium]
MAATADRSAANNKQRTASPSPAGPSAGPPPAGPSPDGPVEDDVGLDGLVIQAADGRSRFMPGGETARLVSALARRPGTVARRAGAFGREVA